jgi:hypothetical protein
MDEPTNGREIARQALSQLTSAAEAADQVRTTQLNASDRKDWQRTTQRIFFGMASLHSILEDPTGAFNGLERMRAQGVPALLDGSISDPEHGRLETGRPLPYVVGHTASAEGVEIGQAVQRLGPPASVWWWSCQQFGNSILSAVREPNGRVFTEFNNDAVALIEAINDLSRPRNARTMHREHPLLGNREATRDQLLARIGGGLIPAELRKVLLVAARSDTPIHLAISAGSPLSGAPLTALPLEDGDPASVYRLVEGAIIVTPPPAMLLRLPDIGKEKKKAVPTGIKLIVGDDVHHPKAWVNSCEVAATNLIEATGAGPATRPAAFDWLRYCEGLLVYYGHVDSGGHESSKATPLGSRTLERSPNRNPFDVQLRIKPTPISAGELLTQRGHGSGTIILAGCGSADPGSMSSGEWWGFPTALLAQGHRHVIGSVWNVGDGTFTAAFVGDVVRALTYLPEAEALRSVQIRWLNQWRKAPASIELSPWVWAGWCCISNRHSR